MGKFTLIQILEEHHFYDHTGKRMLRTDVLHKLNEQKDEIERLETEEIILRNAIKDLIGGGK
jgi:hypothetical protein